MKVGDLVKAKGPRSQYIWRKDMSEGLGIVITAPHRIASSLRGCSVHWALTQETCDIPEDWLEVVNESR